MSFDRHTFPSGGWKFYQPQTKWEAPTPKSSTFDQTVILIIKHRLANPSITKMHKLSTDPYDVATELEVFTAARLGLPNPGGGDFPKQMLPDPSGVGAVEHAKRTIAGIGLVVEWLGDDLEPVPNELAESRAKVCVRCNKNDRGDFWQRIDAVAAEGVRKLIGVAKDMNLKTSMDERLHTCLACDCWLPLKVHAKIGHISKHTSAEVRADLVPECWILAEEAKAK